MGNEACPAFGHTVKPFTSFTARIIVKLIPPLVEVTYYPSFAGLRSGLVIECIVDSCLEVSYFMYSNAKK